LPVSLTGKVAVVTGGSRGIGRAICLALADAGAAVAVNYASRAAEADEVVAMIAEKGGRAIAVQADVSNSTRVDELFAAVRRELGPIDILVNNAALTDTHKPWREIDEDEWDRVMAVNLKSCFLCFRAAYPDMNARGWGRVINISSVTFHLGRPHLVHYIASKGGVIGFTRALAREVGVDGITVNAITPGAILTESELELFPDQAAVSALTNDVQSIKRRGLPADIAGATVYLASDDASFITGQTLNIDGGWAMH
jgi:3-oxoacyl-[acyl-carrier protein] reductase